MAEPRPAAVGVEAAVAAAAAAALGALCVAGVESDVLDDAESVVEQYGVAELAGRSQSASAVAAGPTVDPQAAY